VILSAVPEGPEVINMQRYSPPVETSLWIALALLLAPAAASARANPAPPASDRVVRVGDGTLSGSHIVPYDNLWLVTVHRADGTAQDRGLSSDHVRFREIGGHRYLTRVEGTTAIVGPPGQAPTGNFSMTFNVFDPATMAPVSGEAYGSDGSSMLRQFNGTQVVTRTSAAAGAAPERTEFEMPHPAFDFHGGMTGLLLAGLPLSRGYSALIPGITDAGDDVTRIRVVGRETVGAGHRGRIRAWVVQIGDGPTPAIYWVSRRAPYIIKVTVRSGGSLVSWVMI
jgi:hypothetical protein